MSLVNSRCSMLFDCSRSPSAGAALEVRIFLGEDQSAIVIVQSVGELDRRLIRVMLPQQA